MFACSKLLCHQANESIDDDQVDEFRLYRQRRLSAILLQSSYYGCNRMSVRSISLRIARPRYAANVSRVVPMVELVGELSYQGGKPFEGHERAQVKFLIMKKSSRESSARFSRPIWNMCIDNNSSGIWIGSGAVQYDEPGYHHCALPYGPGVCRLSLTKVQYCWVINWIRTKPYSTHLGLFSDTNALRMFLEANGVEVVIRFTFATQSSSYVRLNDTRYTTVPSIPIKTRYRPKLGSFSPSGEGEENSQQ